MALHMCDKYQNITKITGLFSFDVVFPAFFEENEGHSISHSRRPSIVLFVRTSAPPLT